jgi:dihydrofolate reductase
MSENRVIGRNNRIPWHLPEDFKWFKELTWGQVIVMGRSTFESLGKALPGRTTIVLSRTRASIPGVQVLSSLDEINPSEFSAPIFICGGSQVYAEALPFCDRLYLTLVRQTCEGDTFFPAFEEDFELIGQIRESPLLKILHFRNRRPLLPPGFRQA